MTNTASEWESRVPTQAPGSGACAHDRQPCASVEGRFPSGRFQCPGRVMPTPESFHSDSTVAILTGEPCGPLIKLFQNEKFSLKKMLGKDAVSSSSFFLN